MTKRVWHRHSCRCLLPQEGHRGTGKSACATRSFALRSGFLLRAPARLRLVHAARRLNFHHRFCRSTASNTFGANASQIAVSPMPFASVIPTGAPRKSCPFRKSLARSGGTPREYLPRCRFREFSQSNRRDRHSGDLSGNSLWQHGQPYSLGVPPLRAKDFLCEQDYRGAPVGMTSFSGFRKGSDANGEAFHPRIRSRFSPRRAQDINSHGWLDSISRHKASLIDR